MNMLRKFLCSTLAFALLLSPLASQAAVDTPIEAIPPIITARNARPMIMLNMSRDHQLFYRAYTEFADIDGDGAPDTTYKTGYTYYGYFDPSKCYAYVGTSGGRFEPSGAAEPDTHYCSGNWSGNFLNWATMTRMDIVRKVLYGGTRSTDTADLTVLERASLPSDAHSFAKYYNGSDLGRLTPFSAREITLCNTTYANGTGVDKWSHTTTQPPLIRVAQGNYQLWNANERWQCQWSEDRKTDNQIKASVMPGVSAANPSRAAQGLQSGGSGPDYVVRVKVCDPAQQGSGSEKCVAYTSDAGKTVYKPTGLLQSFATGDKAEFALLTGSFDSNIQGGILRSPMGDFNEEINQQTGIFKKNSDASFRSGIVKSLDALRVFGFDYAPATYSYYDPSDASSPNTGGHFCTYQTIGLTNGQCVSWGNPIGEMMLESLRYLGGQKAPTGDYLPTATPRDDWLGLPKVTEWTDPLNQSSDRTSRYGKAQCRPANVVNFNASVISYDGDNLGDFKDRVSGALGTIGNTALTAKDGTKLPAIAGGKWFVGRSGTNDDKRCTAKDIGSLSSADGLCPDAPGYRGSFSSAGLAYWAHTNRIRTEIPGVTLKDLSGGDVGKVAGFVNTYSVALSPGKPRIEIKADNATVVIQPAYTLSKSATETGAGTLVDFRVIEQSATSGRYLVIWEDSEQGGDYDQDAGGILEWKLEGGKVYVTTSVYTASTSNGQGFGYTISGTDKDGAHYHSGILGFNFQTDPTNLVVTDVNGNPHPKVNATGGCANCQVNDAPSRAEYTVKGGAANSLQDPLWYAALWGGFPRKTTNDTLPKTGEWDSKVPGTPDNYFLVFNPAKLESALSAAFTSAVNNSNAAPAVSSSQLNVGSTRYTAQFDPDARTGDVEASTLNAAGDFKLAWKASARVNAKIKAGNRFVVTEDAGAGVEFTATGLSNAYKEALKSQDSGSVVKTDADVADLIAYVRGDRSNDGGKFRKRDADKGTDNNLLGPIVNSVPWVQGLPSAAYMGSQFPGYADFASKRLDRHRLLWVGSNDGMLHAFKVLPKLTDSSGASLPNADADGELVLSFVPGVLAPRLQSTAGIDGGQTAMFDGSPYTGDVYANGQWRTYLFSSLGRGGQALYALDVTNVGQVAGTTAADVFKWRFTADDDKDLGYVLTTPTVDRGSSQPTPIVKLNNGKFAIITGNGYKSSTGRAALFLLPVDGPGSGGWNTGNYYKIVAESADAAAGNPNGLSAPNWVDLDGNGTADVVYAGDLRGNLWKFDISSKDSTAWSVVRQPLVTAQESAGTGARLPITTMPEFAAPNFGGLMVLFGTGKAVEGSDFPDPRKKKQRFYGIWDGSYLPSMRTDTNSRTLLERKLTRTGSSGNISIIDTETYDWTKHSGWYFDFLDESEMVLFNPVVASGALVFTTARPPKAESDMNAAEKNEAAESCGQGPRGRLYVVDPVYGKASTRVRIILADSAADANTVATDISSLQGSLVFDRLKSSYDDGSRIGDECKEGTAGCVCTGSGNERKCTKEQASGCLPGTEGAKRFVSSSGEDAKICFSIYNARIHWREVPGMRTKQ